MYRPSRRRRGWLALIGGAHLLALWCWKAPQKPLEASTGPYAAMTYLLAPPRPPTPRPPARQARRNPPPPVPSARAVTAAPSQPITLPAPVAEPANAPPAISQAAPLPDPFAVPVKPELDLKQRAIAGASAADKQVRKESFTQRDRKLVNDETALAAAIGKAYRGGGVRTQEIVAADGSRITKFIMPGGAAVCYYVESNHFSGGRDPFKDSGRVSARSCP